MKDRLHLFLMTVLVFTACSAPAPIEETREVTRIVEQTVMVTPAPPTVTRSPADEVWKYTDMTVGFIQTGSESAWRAANTASFKETAEQLGIELKVCDASAKTSTLHSAFRQFIEDDEVDVIILAAFEATGWDDLLREAQAAGKIVILEDRRIDAPGDLYATFVGPDFVEEGRRAGRAMVTLLKDSPNRNIVELAGTKGSSAAEERARGFREALEGSGVVITQSQTANFAKGEGKAVMAAISKESTDIQGVFAHNDEMGLGAIEALKEAGFQPGVDIKIVSMDGMSDAFKAMLAGELNASVEYNPWIAPQAYEAALRALNGEPLPKFIPTIETVFYATDPNLAEVFKTRRY